MGGAMKAALLLDFAAAAFANDSAMEMLHRTAETYRHSGRIEFNVTIQKLENGGEKVSEGSAVCRPGFDQIDQHVRRAEIAREERYNQQREPVAIVIVRVMRDRWPDGTLPGAQFAMYRIDQKTFRLAYTKAAPSDRARGTYGLEAITVMKATHTLGH
jgi:hypothetical protein